MTQAIEEHVQPRETFVPPSAASLPPQTNWVGVVMFESPGRRSKLDSAEAQPMNP